MNSDGMIKGPVNEFDLQTVLGTTAYDWGELCTHANINPMAKYKPIRNSKVVALSPQQGSTPSDRYAARFGFESITPRITFNGNIDPHSKWVYLKPRGGAYGEPYRITDFTNEENPTSLYGYNQKAVPPFAFSLEGLELTANQTADGIGGVGISLYVNSGVNSYYPEGGWSPDTCMTTSELMNFYNGGSYIGFAIQDITNTTGGFVAVVTRHKLKSVSSSVPTVVLYSKNHQTQGTLFSPAVSLLYSGASRAGHIFRFIAFLYDSFPSFTVDGTTYNDQTAEYSILTTTANFDAYSLEFVDNVDRHDIMAYLVQGGITGLTGFIQGPGVTLSLTSSTLVPFNGGGEYYKYQIGGIVYGTFVTPTGHWNPDGQVRIHLRIASNGIPSHTEGGNFEYTVNVPMNSGNTTYNNLTLINFTTLTEPAYIYVDKYAARAEDSFIKITCFATPSNVTIGEVVYIDGVITATSPRITT